MKRRMMKRRSYRRRRGRSRVLTVRQLTQRGMGYKSRPQKWFKPIYDQQTILAKFTYMERINFTSDTLSSYYTFNGNDAYDPYIGLGNDSAINLARAASYYYKGYCWKSRIRIDIQSVSASNGWDVCILPNLTTFAGSSDLVDLYARYKSTSPGGKLYTITGGDKTAASIKAVSYTKKLFPEFDTRHDGQFQHVLSSSPATTWKWNFLFSATYGTGNLPKFNAKVTIDYYYVLMSPYVNTIA